MKYNEVDINKVRHVVFECGILVGFGIACLIVVFIDFGLALYFNVPGPVMGLEGVGHLMILIGGLMSLLVGMWGYLSGKT